MNNVEVGGTNPRAIQNVQKFLIPQKLNYEWPTVDWKPYQKHKQSINIHFVYIYIIDCIL